MISETIVPGVAMWSRYQPDRAMNFNSWFVAGTGGNFVVDPLEPDDAVLAYVRARGLHAVVITNRDHERAATMFAREFSCEVILPQADAHECTITADRTMADGTDVFGWHAIAFDGFKSPGELALYHPDLQTAITGDAFWGVPAGGLTLMPDAKLADPARAALSARSLLAHPLKHLLVGDGTPIYERAWTALRDMLDARDGVLVRRVNFDELPFRGEAGDFAPFTATYAEAGRRIGAERLGYAVGRMLPGEVYCPFHWHTREEEIYIVLEGTPTLRVPAGTFVLQRGDIVSFGTSARHAHRLSNESNEPATVFMLANVDGGDVCTYPDSDKILVEQTDVLVRATPQLKYFDGE